MYTIPEISFDELTGRDGSIGLIVLKRQHALNALSLIMLNTIHRQLLEWESASHIKAVVIRAAEGRAFCAGGDIRYVYDRKIADDAALLHYFRDEYRLNHKINCFRKPYIALINGITMGGGAGISIHGSHRVATDDLVFSMPETAIGFYPDVGMTYILSRLPHNIGLYIGLTGARLTRADCMALELVDAAVSRDQFPELIYTLLDTSLDEDPRSAITEVLEHFSATSEHSLLWEHREEIDSIFSLKTVEDILKALSVGSSWAQETSALLFKKAPLSLKLTLQALKKATTLDFDECMEMEYNLTRNILNGSDFFEGIRVTVINRGDTPRWNPKELRDVSNKIINSYFEQTESLLQENRF